MSDADPEGEPPSHADEQYIRDLERYRRRLDGAMFAGDLAWWEMDVETGAVEFHENKADLLGQSPDAFDHYEDFTDLLHPADYDRAMDAMRDHLEGRAERYDVEYRIETAAGDVRWFHDVGGVTDRHPDGSPRTVTGVVVDVTARKRAEEGLKRTNEELALLNRIVRHDIRNDMTVALGWSEALEPHVDEEGQEILDRIQATHRHTVTVTEVVRDFVDALGSGGRVDLEPTRLDTVLEQELAKRRTLYPEATFAVSGEVPAVTVAANELLSSVFRNLLNNAVQHSDRDDPTVEVGVDVDDETVTVRIADDGPGVPDDRKEHIFGRDTGLDDPNAGVGLYLVNSLVRSYGGTVRVEDNDPRGSVFVVVLGRADE
jgi:PAS domain S-box-containing protein